MEIVKMQSETGEGMELQIYKHVILGNVGYHNAEWGFHYARDFEYKPKDILLCSYPKSGFHLFCNTIRKLKCLNNSNKQIDTHLEIGPADVFESQSDPRIICSHINPSHLLNDRIQKSCKIVLVFRNPKDVLVSFFHYLRNSAAYNNKQTFEEFFQSFVSGILPHGSYFDYLKEWERVLKEKAAGSGKMQVEVFYYEDFLLNRKENLMRLNDYLGFNRDEDYLARVLKETTLEALREQDILSRDRLHFAVRDKEGKSVIYRKGRVGDWKNYLTAAQSEMIDTMTKEILTNEIIKFKNDM